MPWKFVWTPGFHGIFTKQQSGSKQNEMNRKSKNTVKNRWDFVGIFTCDLKCERVCVCVCALARMCVFV